MEVSLYQAAAAMNATAQWQEMIAENLTTAQISGGRKREISFSDVQAGMDPNAANGAQSGYMVPTAQAFTNFQPGELHASSNPMDFALEGPGYFNIQLPNGDVAYTRGGEFQLNAKGQLVTNQRYPILGDGGPIQLNHYNPDGVPGSATGEVSQGQEHKGKLKLTEFAHPQNLTMLGPDQFREDSPDA